MFKFKYYIFGFFAAIILLAGSFVIAAPKNAGNIFRNITPEADDTYYNATTTRQWKETHSYNYCISGDCISAWSDVSGNPFDQWLDTTSSPTFSGLTVTDFNFTNATGTYLYVTNPPTISPTRVYDNIHQLTDRKYVNEAVTSLGQRFWMLDDADTGGSPYKLTTTTPDGANESYTVNNLVNNQYVMGWISPVGGSPSKLIEGLYNWVMFANQSGGTGKKDLRLYWTLIEYKVDTSEVVIATSTMSDILNTTITQEDIFLNLEDDYTPDSGSRIVGKIYADVSGSGGDPSVTLYYEGDYDSHWEIPTNLEVLQNEFVPYNGAITDVDLGNNDLTVGGSTSLATTTVNNGTLTVTDTRDVSSGIYFLTDSQLEGNFLAGTIPFAVAGRLTATGDEAFSHGGGVIGWATDHTSSKGALIGVEGRIDGHATSSGLVYDAVQGRCRWYDDDAGNTNTNTSNCFSFDAVREVYDNDQATPRLEGNVAGLYVPNAIGSANNWGIKIDDQTGHSLDYGIVVDGADTNVLWLGAGAHGTDEANGIVFGLGKDVNLYRGDTNQLRTDDFLVVDNSIAAYDDDAQGYVFAYDTSRTDYINIYDNGTNANIQSNNNPINIWSGGNSVSIHNSGLTNNVTFDLTTSTNITTLGSRFSFNAPVYASSTSQFDSLYVYGGATTTNLAISGITGTDQCLQVDTNGTITGTGSACGSGSGGGAAWEYDSGYDAITPTSTKGLYVSASSTFSGGLRVDGNSTTTGIQVIGFGSKVGDNPSGRYFEYEDLSFGFLGTFPTIHPYGATGGALSAETLGVKGNLFLVESDTGGEQASPALYFGADDVGSTGNSAQISYATTSKALAIVDPSGGAGVTSFVSTVDTTISGDLGVTGDLGVGGTFSPTNLSVTNDLTVGGNSTTTGKAVFSDDLTINKKLYIPEGGNLLFGTTTQSATWQTACDDGFQCFDNTSYVYGAFAANFRNRTYQMSTSTVAGGSILGFFEVGSQGNLDGNFSSYNFYLDTDVTNSNHDIYGAYLHINGTANSGSSHGGTTQYNTYMYSTANASSTYGLYALNNPSLGIQVSTTTAIYAEAINATNNIAIETNGGDNIFRNLVYAPDAYSNDISAGTYRDLYIQDNGELGYISSSIESKELVEDLTKNDTSFIYDLKPKEFEYKEDKNNTKHYGLIAEEVVNIKPELVSYKMEKVGENCEEYPITDNKTQTTRMETRCRPIYEKTNELATVNYNDPMLITALIKEVQELKNKQLELESRIATLEGIEKVVMASSELSIIDRIIIFMNNLI